MTRFNFPNLVGFNNFFEELELLAARNANNNYPPFNVKEVDETHYIIEMACAGFKKAELDISVKPGFVTVSGDKTPSDNKEVYQYKGLAFRSFKQVFPLAKDIVVNNASYVDGVLSIYLERIVPEEAKPRKLDILDTEVPWFSPKAITAKT